MAEDLVTYQISKKLKEKGFPINGKEIICGDNGVFIPTPTIYQVLKWLRETGIHINIEICVTGWYCSIYPFSKDENGLYDINDTYLCVGNIYDDYKEAALSAIEYILDNNLI